MINYKVLFNIVMEIQIKFRKGVRLNNTTYINELIVWLKNSGLGCHVGTEFIGALGNGDDHTLICPSLNALSQMLCVRTDFAKQYNSVFNAQKTMEITFGAPVTQQDCIQLNNNAIQWVDQVRHLGNIVHSNLADLPDCKLKQSTFNGSVKRLFATYKGLNQDTMCQIFFGAVVALFMVQQLWDLKSSGFTQCCVH